MPLTVRAADPGDARRIAEIHVASWQAAYRGVMTDEFLDGLSVEKRMEGWARPLRSPEQRLWVADDDGRVVAFLLAGPSRDADAAPGVSEIIAFYADPARWGTGAGRALIDHVFLDLARRGLAGVTLWVLESNARARRFYEIAGLRPDGGQKTVTLGGADLREVRYAFPSEFRVRST